MKNIRKCLIKGKFENTKLKTKNKIQELKYFQFGCLFYCFLYLYVKENRGTLIFGMVKDADNNYYCTKNQVG